MAFLLANPTYILLLAQPLCWLSLLKARPALDRLHGAKSLVFRNNVVAIERMQKRFARNLPGMECFSYQERLDRAVYSWEAERGTYGGSQKM